MADYTGAVTSFLQDARALIVQSSFQRNCVDRLLNPEVTPNVSVIGFVDGLGQSANNAVTNLSTRADLWGVTYRTCTAACNYKDLPFPFDYTEFSSSLTSYLLPWLGLTAQLPYETGYDSSNIMALFMALGSPVLITYSLSLTVINSYKLKHIFNQLKNFKTIPQQYSKHLTTIQEVLQASQHVPLRPSQRGGWLSSLLVLKENDDWWDEVCEYLMGHVRDFSPSALAQIGFAVVAWLLTVVAALSNKLGDPDTGLQIASGSLWIWLVPVVVGYITVGVPNSSRATPDAFARHGAQKAGRWYGISNRAHSSPTHSPSRLNSSAALASDDITLTSSQNHRPRQRSVSRSPVSPGARSTTTSPPPPREEDLQLQGLDTELKSLDVPPTVTQRFDSGNDVPQRSDLSSQRGPISARDDNKMRGIRTSGGWFTASGETNSRLPMALGLPVLGDANVSGAAYTYARSLEFPFFVDLLTNALANSIEQDPDRTLAETRKMSSAAVAKQCGPDWEVDMNLNPFPSWTQISADCWHRIFIAAAMALFVQWGTTLAAFVLAFLTPVKGIGCRSGSYMVYGIVSTAAWLFLVASQLCSNEAMRIMQERVWAPDGSTRPRTHILPEPFEDDIGTQQQRRIRRQSTVQIEAHDTAVRDNNTKLAILRNAAVLLRVSGKVMCVLNTIWLILTSVAEITGGFENCWCLADRPSVSEDNAWIILFKTSADLASQAQSSWGGGFAISIAVCLSAITFFVIGSPRHRGS